MGNVSVKLTNPTATARRLTNLCYQYAMPIVAEQILSDCNTYVRMQEGTLADSAHIRKRGREIVWSTAYAKRVYYTGTPRRNKNPNASLRWCEVAKRKHASVWAEQLTKLMGGR